MKIIVIGCTHAGTAAVVNLKELHPESEITIYEKNDNISFLSCGIALNVGGVIKETKNLFYNSPENLSKMGIVTNMKHEVLDIDFDNKVVKVTFPSKTMVKQSVLVNKDSIEEMIKEGYDRTKYILKNVFAEGYENLDCIYNNIEQMNKDTNNHSLRITGDVLVTNLNKITQKLTRKKVI